MLYSIAPKDTLGYALKGVALTSYLDRSSATVGAVADAVAASGIFGMPVQPDEQALKFYLGNQAMAHLSKKFDILEPLPQEVMGLVKAHSHESARIAIRLFWYVFIICAREARHNKSSVDGKLDAVFSYVTGHYPEADKATVQSMFYFSKTFPDSHEALTHLQSSTCANFQIGPFVATLAGVYRKCSWSSAFGGPKWAHIAECLLKFIKGEWSAEIFADTAFTLAHNTAPIFNKGMLYNHPTPSFIEILDVQRAGMVPLWLDQDPTGKHFVALVGDMYTLTKKLVPDMFEGYLDWHTVESLGSVHKYAHKDTYGVKPGAKTILIDTTLTVEVEEIERMAA